MNQLLIGATSDWMKKRREFLGQFFGVVEEKPTSFRHSNKTANSNSIYSHSKLSQGEKDFAIEEF